MSCCDIVGSVGFALQPFLVASTESQWVWAVGNDATCTMIGTIQQFAMSSMLYPGMLSLYFVLTV